MQDALRAELRRELTPGEDPTHDKLVNGLPYLDAITCEVLRLHPPLQEMTREVSRLSTPTFHSLKLFISRISIPSQTQEDDTIPLAHPTRTASGDFTDTIFVPKGTIIRIPVVGVHRSEALWGADAAQFNPKRWLNVPDDAAGARSAEIPGYKHLLTFGYGPRMCLGRNFAVTEIKVRSFSSLALDLAVWSSSLVPFGVQGCPFPFNTPLHL